MEFGDQGGTTHPLPCAETQEEGCHVCGVQPIPLPTHDTRRKCVRDMWFVFDTLLVAPRWHSALVLVIKTRAHCLLQALMIVETWGVYVLTLAECNANRSETHSKLQHRFLDA